MSEAEFERRQNPAAVYDEGGDDSADDDNESTATRTSSSSRSRASRSKPAAKSKRVQRMFAIEEDLDRKLWLYAIHLGKDRSEVINDLLRPVVTSMVLYDSRDRRSSSTSNSSSTSRAADSDATDSASAEDN
jgi:hypothetical protein